MPACILSPLALSACSGGSPPVNSSSAPPPPPSGVTVLTYHNDVARTGQNLNETSLTTSNVNSTQFGLLGTIPVDGFVDAGPLYVGGMTIAGGTHNVLFVATEGDSVYAFDADTFAQLWHVSVLGTNESPSDDRDCTQVQPTIGVTSTRVIDPSAGTHGTIFVVAMSIDAGGNCRQRLHALDLTTGNEHARSPALITATFPNQGGQTTFAPGQYEERTGLLLLNGVIYLAWTSHCDDTPYTGWVMGYSESSLQQTRVIDITPNGVQGGIWMSGDGLAADPCGNIYFLDGNGTFDTTLSNGLPINADYGNAFIKLSIAGNTLAVADYFTMFDTVNQSNSDADLGSGGVLLLPNLTDAHGNTWHLAVGAGKPDVTTGQTVIYVVNRDSMGKFNPTSDTGIYQEFTPGITGKIKSTPAYFNGAVYCGAVGDSLKVFKITNALLGTSPSSFSPTAFVYPGTTPSISANGTANGIVWAIENGSSTGTLHAYDATNSNCKFVTPLIANGKVYVGAGPTSNSDGSSVPVFRLPN
jgi:PQQ-like domain